MKTRNYIIATVIFIVITAVFSVFPHTKFNKKMYFNTFQGVFNKKIELANFYTKKLENADFKEALEVNSYIRDRGLHFLIYDKDNLSFWSTNSFELPSSLNEIDTAKKLIWISNLHFYQVVRQFDNRTIIALINLETRFPFHNDYMINGIRPEFGLPEGSTISEISDDEMSIVDVEGNKLFAIDMQSGSTNYFNLLITTILFFITIVLTLVALYYVSKNYIRKTNRYVFLFALSLLLLLLRVIFIRHGIIPTRLLSFDPFIYASFIAPTLGDLLINSLVFFWFGYTLFRLVKLPDSFFQTKTHSTISLILLFVGLIGVFQFVFNVSLSLVEHSTLNLVVNRIDDITLDLAIGYFVLLLNHMGVAFCMLWMMQMLKSRIDFKQQSLVLFITIGVALAIIFALGIKTNILAFVFLYAVYIVSALIQNKTNRSFFISYLLLAVILLSVYIEVFTIYYSSIKEENYKITFAEDLASEQDAYVKYLVVALTDSILKDEFINQAVFDTSIEAKLVHDHLKDKYFGGYWKKYELHTMNICKPYNFLAGSGLNCYEFYDTLVNDLGYKIPGADFYFLNNYNGNISYLGTITFVNDKGQEAKLYLELDSQSSHDLLDYPKLLLD
ncbi:MAG: hypothetical protein MI922_29385, partial [Bacteroidales bacterium]|nr:hypothetical protein [Bacteroidales bacterium]